MVFKTVLLLALLLVGRPLAVMAQFTLEVVEKTVALKYKMEHIPWEVLKSKLDSKERTDYVVFDTRPPKEYKEGHIESAIQVDPEMAAAGFVEKYGETIKGKQVVFYCSVGYRSSEFVERLQKEAPQNGASALSNLRGGIFRWYNEGNRVVNAAGEAKDIHPYNRVWGTLIKKRP